MAQRQVSQRCTIISGGAIGSDCLWATLGRDHGAEVEICTFESHRVVGPSTKKLLLSSIQRRNALAELKRAAVALGRRASFKNNYIRDLLCRNYLIATRSDGSVAIIESKPTPSTRKYDCGVAGGTGWQCQLHIQHRLAIGQPLRMAVYAQQQKAWYTASMKDGHIEWTQNDDVAASFHGLKHIGCVGTRKINSSGKAAARQLIQTILDCGEPDAKRIKLAANRP
eukprot:TRINITY_DN8421_c0_g1_i1.p1 TRINITY_DN8421_c0_g1~~TRINITY_DN8421_c0_g1_i1.p1  ORF type:complete len:225 (+),score=14.70 TRINITY_DN8421_c0_g1_i1:556-1230(+)